jgi:UDP-N-acetylmuramyl pentapeptide phosphotransferase/UDP-N-acetylglucosamine-1-phosphate transferase
MSIFPLLVAFAASFAASLALVATRNFHGHLTLDAVAGTQKIHSNAVPRIGGLAVSLGFEAGGFSIAGAGDHLWWVLAACCLPAFAFGLLEDVTKRVGVRVRLLATVLAGTLFAGVTGFTLHHLGIWPVDLILALPFVAILFTGFAIGGVANAMNIVDGCNGLASGTAMILLAAFAAIAWQAGDAELVAVCLIGIGSIAGFFLVNFPHGRLFLGDAGAYSVGFLLAAIAVALPARNAGISPVIGLLVLIYPVTETLYSIARRVLSRGAAVGQPDRLHLHSLTFQALRSEIRRTVHRNSMASVILWSLPASSAVLAVILARSSVATVLLGAAVVVVFYRALYAFATLGARDAPVPVAVTEPATPARPKPPPPRKADALPELEPTTMVEGVHG